jgi:hypothetical protein
MAVGRDMSVVAMPDLSVPVTNDLSTGDDLSSGGGGGAGGGGTGGGGGGGGKGGCSCDLAGRDRAPAPWGYMVVVLVLGGGLLRRRRTQRI